MITMKKTSCALLIAALLVAVPGVSRAVELEPDCGYVYNSTFGSPPGFDAMFFEIAALLTSIGVELPEDWHDADMESVAGEMDGDGIPDWYQLGMLGAVLCSAGEKDLPVPADVLVQFNTNVALFNGLIVKIVALLDAFGPLGADMLTVGADLIALGEALGPGYEALIELGEGMVAGGEEFVGFVEEFGILAIALPLYANWFAGMAGLSSEMDATVTALLDGLLENLEGIDAQLAFLAANLEAIAALIEPADPGLAADCLALAADMVAAIPLLDIVAPDFEIYGVIGKTEDEPFSAFGDYNEDDLSNGDTYDAVTGGGGDRPVFVGAATGSNPFWPGNPGLPVAGGFGLALLTGACAVAGAFSIRKK